MVSLSHILCSFSRLLKTQVFTSSTNILSFHPLVVKSNLIYFSRARVNISFVLPPVPSSGGGTWGVFSTGVFALSQLPAITQVSPSLFRASKISGYLTVAPFLQGE